MASGRKGLVFVGQVDIRCAIAISRGAHHMARYEYKVVPAPAKGQKAKGIKTAEGRFALSVEAVLNTMGSSGWEYLRAELLPSEERSGLTGSTTNWRNVLVFRRPLESEAEAFQPRVLETPAHVAPPVVTAPSVVPEEPEVVPVLSASAAHEPDQTAADEESGTWAEDEPLRVDPVRDPGR